MLALSSLRTRAAVALPQLVRSMATKTREMVMGRAHRGLYGGKHIQFGNNVSHSHRKCAACSRAAARVAPVSGRVRLLAEA